MLSQTHELALVGLNRQVCSKPHHMLQTSARPCVHIECTQLNYQMHEEELTYPLCRSSMHFVGQAMLL